MVNTIANVLSGVAQLSIREPNDAIAEWSTVQQQVGSYSARLWKGNSGDNGSTHLQIIPVTKQTLTAFVADPTDYSFFYWYSAVTGNFIQFELRFEDPDSDAWVEATVVPHQNVLGTGAWLQKILAGADLVGFGGIGELGASFFDWDLGTTISTLITDIDAKAEVTSSGEWTLQRVRLELWEATPERTAYVDTVELDGVTYTVEPGGTAPAMTMSSPFVDIGYTEDGVTLTYTSETADVEVEEETFAIDRLLTKEILEITVNMAESSLANLGNAMPGSVRSGNIITFGAGVMKTMNMKLVGVTPGGFIRTIQIPKATAMGAVGIPYKKGEKTVVPVTFQALKDATGLIAIIDNAA